ncbi:hypothetical protein DXG01_004693, partial [Tephrocybe rancida]
VLFALALLAKCATASFPFATQASFSIIVNPGGLPGVNNDTRLYFQSMEGLITEISISGPFDTGFVHSSPFTVSHNANETLPATPVSAGILGPGFTEESHIYFFQENISPENNIDTGPRLLSVP